MYAKFKVLNLYQRLGLKLRRYDSGDAKRIRGGGDKKEDGEKPLPSSGSEAMSEANLFCYCLGNCSFKVSIKTPSLLPMLHRPIRRRKLSTVFM